MHWQFCSFTFYSVNIFCFFFPGVSLICTFLFCHEELPYFCVAINLMRVVGYVLEVEGAAVSNAKVVLNRCPEMQEKIETEAAEQERQQREETNAIIEQDLLDANTCVFIS